MGRISKTKRIGVLTGDLVGSTAYSPELLEHVLSGFDALVKTLSGRKTLCYDSLVIFRGDGWQLVTRPLPSAVLTVATLIRTFVRFSSDTIPCDSRVGMSIGSHQGIVLKKSASYQGDAFTASGTILEEWMKDQPGRMAYWHRENVESAHPHLPFVASAVYLLDHLISSWTPAQCQAVHYALLGYTQAETGAAWRKNLSTPKPISKAAVGQHLKAADFITLERFLATVESEEAYLG